ncbi:hypothetical protein [Vibrio coralliilyticus]|uniref:hypothetical protein n=1 Tax=Vibrio coralliilyticus TaxID=190893 RepID=UPI0015618C3B|nr:hypothetical protein [Vibrio coralliilyticus]NRF64532.1 hypothetical protein [Vibrio coralliilyticus]
MEYSYTSIDVTPAQSSYPLAGFAKRNLELETFGDSSLYLKFFWLRTSDTNLIIVTLDTLYFPTTLSKLIVSELNKQYGVEESEIIFSATHTHSSPNTSIPKFGEIYEDYLAVLKQPVAEAVSNLSKFFRKCQVEVSLKELGDQAPIIGRRKTFRVPMLGKMITLMLPNNRQEIDNELRVIKLTSDRDEFLIYNFSCHPVFNSNNKVSSDFIGVIDKSITQGGVVGSLFLQGFCGDIRPKLISSKEQCRGIKTKLKFLILGGSFRAPNRQDFESFVNFFSSSLKCPSFDRKVDVALFSSKSFRYEFASESGDSKKSVVVKLFFSFPLVMVSIPAEVLSSYYVALKKTFPNVIFLPMAYGENMIGYLPHHTDFHSGGYEVSSYANYGWDSVISYQSLVGFEKKLFKEIEQGISKVYSK